jgi:uncharacterized membrane protein
MKDRAKIRLPLNRFDKTIEVLGWIALFAIWVLTLFNYSTLPETIPIHYNGAGEADRFGNKSNILILPIISTILFLGLNFLNKFPEKFNHPIKENAFDQYINATRMIRFLKLVIVLIFGLIIFKTIQNVNGNADGLGEWFLPLSIGLIFIPMIYYFTKSI